MKQCVNFDLAVDNLNPTVDDVQSWLENVKHIQPSEVRVTAVSDKYDWPNVTAVFNGQSELENRQLLGYIYNDDMSEPVDKTDWASLLVDSAS